MGLFICAKFYWNICALQGVGYHLIMVKDDTCNVASVTGFITKYVPNAKLESNISAELSYNLPSESSSKFEVLMLQEF